MYCQCQSNTKVKHRVSRYQIQLNQAQKQELKDWYMSLQIEFWSPYCMKWHNGKNLTLPLLKALRSRGPTLPPQSLCPHMKMALHETKIPACWMPLCSLIRYKSLFWGTQTAPILPMELKAVFLLNCMLWLWGGMACSPEDTLSKQSYPRGEVKGVLQDSTCTPNKKIP